jgi:2-desacetyl-2-hydroxyethyl bacteriochlorophyllide A dehydrogenase
MDMMKAAVLVEPRRFEVRAVPLQEVGPDDVLIKVSRCGICGTDIHMFNGHYAADELPIIPGHEFAGTIARTGKNIARFTEGQKVVADINVGCGHCYYCRRNEILNCAEVRQIGISRDGAFAEYVTVPSRLVIPVPDNAPFEILALTARKARSGFAQSVVILGAGPIGNLHVQMMRLIGAAPIIVLELSPARAELARKAGADIVETNPEKIRETVLAMTDGRGADIVIESVGLPQLYVSAFELMRPGGHLAAFGITGPEDTIPLHLLNTILREYSLKGSVAGMGEDMHDALTLLVHNRFDTSAFTGVSFAIDSIQEAFDTLANRPEVLKTQIVM